MDLSGEQAPHASVQTGSLVHWQQSLLSALWAPSVDEALRRLDSDGPTGDPYQRRGLAAYRSHATLQSTRTLAAVYPVVESLLGAENFHGLSRTLWRACPPQHGDLGQWGEAMAAYIESLTELAQAEPYLADVARLEWALHQAERAADEEPDPASLALLVTEDPAELAVVLAPGAGSLTSRWPVVSALQIHRQRKPVPQQVLLEGEAETAIYWRQGWVPRLRLAQNGEASFLEAVQAGQSLESALERAEGFDFSGWLTPAYQEGLLSGVLSLSQA